MYKINATGSPFKQTSEHVWEATVTEKVTLQDVFNYCEGLVYEDQLIIKIAKDVNTILRERCVPLASGYRVPICCSSISIIGQNSVTFNDKNRRPNRVYLAQTLIAYNGVHGDKTITYQDTLLQFEGLSMEQPISVHLENIEFMPVGLSETAEDANSFTPSDNTNFEREAHLIKIVNGDGIFMRNVYSTLANGPITNVDIRHARNVVIRECILTNYNGLKPGNSTGGNLWLRDDLSNIRIEGNIFNKFGNDEALALYSQGNYSNAFETIEDVNIFDNTFVYARPDKMASNIANLAAIIPIQVLIAFYGSQPIKFRNILFMRNKIEANHPVYRVFAFWHYQNLLEMKNFRVINNLIEHTYQLSGWALNAYSMDFDFGTVSGINTQSSIPMECEIAYNVVNASQTIGATTYSHCFVQNYLASLNVHNNIINGKSFSSANTKGVVLLRARYKTQYNRFSNNVIDNCEHPLFVADVEDGQRINVEFIENTIEGIGSSSISATTPLLNILLERNYISTTNSNLLFQGFAKAGSIKAIGNVLTALPSSSGSSAVLCSTTSSILTEMIFEHNYVGGNRSVGSNPYLPNAAWRSVANNQFK